MLLFPFFATITSILFVAATLILIGVLQLFIVGLALGTTENLITSLSVLEFLFQIDAGEAVWGVLEIATMLVVYLRLAFIATFFNLCVVYTTKIRLEGGDATFIESIKFGISELAVIFQWILFAATVGLALGILQKLLERFAFIGQLVTGTLGFKWSVVVLIVVPILVYENVWPVQAVHCSKEGLRDTWGESLFRHLGLGIIQLLCVLAVMAVTLVLVKLIPLGLGTLLVIKFGVVISLSIILVFAVANTIFNTALYVYASTGKEPTEFGAELLMSAFKNKR